VAIGKSQKPQYPQNWPDVSKRIRFVRANGQCECEGECGLHRTNPGPRHCVERDGEPAKWANGIVMLTVAHLDAEGDVCRCLEETGMKCAIEVHLKAMCNRCHLRYDIKQHQRNAARTRRAKKNNFELFDLG
jgi:hypothetical protein